MVGVGVERARLRSDDVRATRSVGETTKATKKRRAKHFRFLIFCAESVFPFGSKNRNVSLWVKCSNRAHFLVTHTKKIREKKPT